MSFAVQETNEEFEDQFRLQKEAVEREKAEAAEKASKKTRVDEDGTVMEWDEKKRAWFPKIDEDFIANYQMNFGVQDEPDSAHRAWQQYAAQLERVKAEKGADCEEVKKGQEALDEYYRSPAYRAWYEDYQKRLEEHKKSGEPLPQRKRPAPVLEVSADEALQRAEEEQRLGVPISTPVVEENTTESGDKPTEAPVRKRKKKGPPEWYEVSEYRFGILYLLHCIDN